MFDCCIYNQFEQCFHNCDFCPQRVLGDEYEPEYDPYDKFEREDVDHEQK